jgi:hypothetical protein
MSSSAGVVEDGAFCLIEGLLGRAEGREGVLVFFERNTGPVYDQLFEEVDRECVGFIIPLFLNNNYIKNSDK